VHRSELEKLQQELDALYDASSAATESAIARLKAEGAAEMKELCARAADGFMGAVDVAVRIADLIRGLK
jgi:hypothetical protein